MEKINKLEKSYNNLKNLNVEKFCGEEFHFLFSAGYPEIENRKNMEEKLGIENVIVLGLKMEILLIIIVSLLGMYK